MADTHFKPRGSSSFSIALDAGAVFAFDPAASGARAGAPVNAPIQRKARRKLAEKVEKSFGRSFAGQLSRVKPLNRSCEREFAVIFFAVGTCRNQFLKRQGQRNGDRGIGRRKLALLKRRVQRPGLSPIPLPFIPLPCPHAQAWLFVRPGMAGELVGSAKQTRREPVGGAPSTVSARWQPFVVYATKGCRARFKFPMHDFEIVEAPQESQPRSAGWQPAVSTTGSRQAALTVVTATDCQSATPQTASPRYIVGHPPTGGLLLNPGRALKLKP